MWRPSTAGTSHPCTLGPRCPALAWSCSCSPSSACLPSQVRWWECLLWGCCARLTDVKPSVRAHDCQTVCKAQGTWWSLLRECRCSVERHPHLESSVAFCACAVSRAGIRTLMWTDCMASLDARVLVSPQPGHDQQVGRDVWEQRL
eukprot:scaffold154808_cov22-Tisochrysis_lutea.AAC.1